MLSDEEKEDLRRRISKLKEEEQRFDNRRPKRPKISGAFRYAHLGMEFAGILLAFLFGSRLLQQQLALGDWIVLVGVFLGFAASLTRLLQVLRDLREEEESENSDDTKNTGAGKS